jgi:hypothetical protein
MPRNIPTATGAEAPSVTVSKVLTKVREEWWDLTLASVNRFLPRALKPIEKASWTNHPILAVNNIGFVFSNVIVPIMLYSTISFIPLLPFRSEIALVVVAFAYCLGIADTLGELTQIYNNTTKNASNSIQTTATTLTTTDQNERAATDGGEAAKQVINQAVGNAELTSETQRVVRLIALGAAYTSPLGSLVATAVCLGTDVIAGAVMKAKAENLAQGVELQRY